MKLSDKSARLILAVIIIFSLTISGAYIGLRKGYHEDELLTYNLANSSKQLNTEGGWNTSEDFNEFLTVFESDRFNYRQVIDNQITDASHPPLYYALVHTISSFFPGTFSRWFAFSINLISMCGVLIFLYLTGKRITGSNIYALLAVAAYGLSIACFATTVYLRMYAALTFCVTAFLYQILRIYDKENKVSPLDLILLFVTVAIGCLTQYYFILFAGLIGLMFLFFQLRRKSVKSLVLTVTVCAAGFAAAMLVYPHIIENIFGGNRGLGSLEFSIDGITIATYIVYKLFCYVYILSKEMFLGQVWLFIFCSVTVILSTCYFRFVKKRKLSPKALIAAVPSIVFLCAISLLSPFNSDRYIMASLPIVSMVFTFAFVRIFSQFKSFRVRMIFPCLIVLSSMLALVLVRPYYLYGKTSLYSPKTSNALVVGTAMMEWNKSIDKFENYDAVMIVQTSEMSKTLGPQLERFATRRGVITHGKIGTLVDSYMNNGSEKELTSSLEKIKDDKKLSKLSEVTVYISRLSDRDYVIKYIKDNTQFKNCELIQSDYDYEEFYNWYDYFMETESYCDVYRFYK